MANYTDLTTVINGVVSQALGEDALAQIDITNIASMGEKVVNSLDDGSLDVVFNTLLDRIGKTIVDNKQYKGRFGYLFKDAFEYGCILQKIHVDNFNAKTNGVYDIQNGDVDEELYKIMLPSVHQTLFENAKPWEFGVTITRDQIKSAFINAETLTAFINGIYIAMASSIEKYMETMGRMAIEQLISVKLVAQANGDAEGETVNHAINLLQAYYDETGVELTPTTCLYNADFLRWCTSTFLDYKNLLNELTVLFNTEGFERFTPNDALVFAINGKFADNIKRYMQSDVYNDALVSMPMYNEVTYWQGLGKRASIADRLSVNTKYKNPLYTVGGEEPEFVETNKLVVALMHDNGAIGVTVKERDTVVIPNPHKHTKNLFEQGVVGNYVDTSENAIVFYIDDVVTGA